MKSAAQVVYQQRKTEIRQGKFQAEDVKRKHQNTTVSQIIDDYLRASESAGLRALKDIRIRANYWKVLWQERAARSIIPQDIEAARLNLADNRLKSNGHKNKPEGGRSVATVNRYLATLKAAFMLLFNCIS